MHDNPGNTSSNWDDSPANMGPRVPGMKGASTGSNGSGTWGEPGSPLSHNWGSKQRSSWGEMHVDTSGWGQPPPKQVRNQLSVCKLLTKIDHVFTSLFWFIFFRAPSRSAKISSKQVFNLEFSQSWATRL